MKNVQVIDGAVNSTFEIYTVPDDTFALIFPEGQNVAFLDAVEKRLSECRIAPENFWDQVYETRIPKIEVVGIHGTLHLTGSSCQEQYFPTHREQDVL